MFKLCMKFTLNYNTNNYRHDILTIDKFYFIIIRLLYYFGQIKIYIKIMYTCYKFILKSCM